MFRHETTARLSGNVNRLNARIWAAAIRIKRTKLNKGAQISTYFVLHKNVLAFLFRIFIFPKELCPDILEEILVLILGNEGPKVMVNEQYGALPHFRITIQKETFHGS